MCTYTGTSKQNKQKDKQANKQTHKTRRQEKKTQQHKIACTRIIKTPISQLIKEQKNTIILKRIKIITNTFAQAKYSTNGRKIDNSNNNNNNNNIYYIILFKKKKKTSK